MLLVFDALRKLFQGKSGEIVIQRSSGVICQRSIQGLPRQFVVAQNSRLGSIFQLARAGIVPIQLDIRFAVRLGPKQQRHCDADCQNNRQSQKRNSAKLHRPPPTCNSLPSVTPAATSMVALSEAGSSTLATPFLMRASTVLLPSLSVSVNVTMVPSGTALPEQSRIGSVSTTMLSLLRWARCIFRLPLHGSEATCCTTRRTLMFPTDATNWAAPSLGPEEASIQATPCWLVTFWLTPVPLTDRLKFTGVG